LGRFPRFIGTVRRSDFSSPVSPCFVSFAWRYRFLSGHGGDEISQVPGGPLCACPALRPRRDQQTEPYLQCAGVAFR